MRDLKEYIIEKVTVCPECFGLKENTECGISVDCKECWKHALRNIDIIEREVRDE
jgi:hypothetical protein